MGEVQLGGGEEKGPGGGGRETRTGGWRRGEWGGGESKRGEEEKSRGLVRAVLFLPQSHLPIIIFVTMQLDPDY